jgi:hypothetical protein
MEPSGEFTYSAELRKVEQRNDEGCCAYDQEGLARRCFGAIVRSTKRLWWRLCEKQGYEDFMGCLEVMSPHMRRSFIDRQYSPSTGMDRSKWEVILEELMCMGYIVK